MCASPGIDSGGTSRDQTGIDIHKRGAGALRCVDSVRIQREGAAADAAAAAVLSLKTIAAVADVDVIESESSLVRAGGCGIDTGDCAVSDDDVSEYELAGCSRVDENAVLAETHDDGVFDVHRLGRGDVDAIDANARAAGTGALDG